MSVNLPEPRIVRGGISNPRKNIAKQIKRQIGARQFRKIRKDANRQAKIEREQDADPADTMGG